MLKAPTYEPSYTVDLLMHFMKGLILLQLDVKLFCLLPLHLVHNLCKKSSKCSCPSLRFQRLWFIYYIHNESCLAGGGGSLTSWSISKWRTGHCGPCLFLKFAALLNNIMKWQIFGCTEGYVYTVEYQKCGLSCIHLIIFLHPDCWLVTTERVDAVISTEFPDETSNPILFKLVKTHMIHSPCSKKSYLPCMNGKKECRKVSQSCFKMKQISQAINMWKWSSKDQTKLSKFVMSLLTTKA